MEVKSQRIRGWAAEVTASLALHLLAASALFGVLLKLLVRHPFKGFAVLLTLGSLLAR